MAFSAHQMKRYLLVVSRALLIVNLGLGVSQPFAFGQGFSPAEAVGRMKLPKDLQVQLVASEPMIAQPVCIEFDARGRLWVIQYLQYPNPAGLKRVTVDRWSRTTYERLPEPPPRGPKGADRLTILEDTDGDGVADKAHDFINGLNLATGLAFGHGGVFVLNVPYLLFYPDRDSDDVPDSEPIVCLKGFGMEDAHSVANSLTWGPDGWLYGCQGSTVTSHIRGIEFQQGVWRYHPLTHQFELFCEGGGNSWGLDFDEEGELIYSTNVGPYRHLHGVQGAYYWKSFGKHGALHNPYAFGFFNHIPHTNFTGGHVTDGGLIYRGANLPARYRGAYLCADLLGHGVQWHDMFRRGSTFTSSHGGYLLEANDTWFAPTDLTVSADGAIYVADWYDRRTAHPDPDAEWDRSNGRVYRISVKGSKPTAVPVLSKFSTAELISLLAGGSDWLARQALRVLADRRDPEAILPLRTLIFDSPNERTSLEALWALYVTGGFNETFATRTLVHRSAPIRKWSVRLLADENHVSPPLAKQLAQLAKTDSDVRVRMQLASSAQRLPGIQALPIVEELLVRDLDGNDPYLPLLLWWAVERHGISTLDVAEQFFISPRAWKSDLVREVIQERLMRRWTAEGTPQTYDACARLLGSAPTPAERHRLLAALEQGFHDRPVAPAGFGSGGLFAKAAAVEMRTNHPVRIEQISPALAAQLDNLWHDDTSDPVLIRIAARTGKGRALARARVLLGDTSLALAVRLNLIQLLGELGDGSDIELLLKFVGDAPESLQLAALEALPRLDSPGLATELLRRYPKLGELVRARTRQILLSRKVWARELLQEVDAGKVPAADFKLEELRAVAPHEDVSLNDLVKKHWGKLSGGTAEERLAEMRRLNNDLNAGLGNSQRGQVVFARVCGACHAIFGQGGGIAPDLTEANRTDRDFLLVSIVDPSAVIRKEYLSYEVETHDGRVLSGIIINQSGSELTLGTSTGDRLILPRAQIASLRESALSVMPENLAKGLTAQELRDLFSFLQSAKPINSKP